jgi:hypothetical protein
VKCFSDHICKCVFRLEVVSLVSFYDRVSFLNTRRWPGLHVVNVHGSDIVL